MAESKSIPVTEEMIGVGIGCLIDYEMGGISAGEAVKQIFVSMLESSSSNLAPAEKDYMPHQKHIEGSLR